MVLESHGKQTVIGHGKWKMMENQLECSVVTLIFRRGFTG